METLKEGLRRRYREDLIRLLMDQGTNEELNEEIEQLENVLVAYKRALALRNSPVREGSVVQVLRVGEGKLVMRTRGKDYPILYGVECGDWKVDKVCYQEGHPYYALLTSWHKNPDEVQTIYPREEK